MIIFFKKIILTIIIFLCTSFLCIRTMHFKEKCRVEPIRKEHIVGHFTFNLTQPYHNESNFHTGIRTYQPYTMPQRPSTVDEKIYQALSENNPYNNPELTQILHEARYQEPAIKTDSKPLFSLVETIAYIDQQSRGNNKHKLIAEKRTIEQQIAEKILFGKDLPRAQKKFIECMLDGSIAQILKTIENAPPDRAFLAFEELCTLWPWKPTNWRTPISFLCNKSMTSEQQSFINSLQLKCNIMQKAEMCLMSRQDVLRFINPKNCGSIKTAFMNYQKLQQKGEYHLLLKEKRTIEKILISNKDAKNYPYLKANLAILNNILSNPLTNIFSTIAHSNLKTARAELCFLEQQIIDQLNENNIVSINEARHYLEKIHGCDVLSIAHDLYRSRQDFTYSSENQSILTNTLDVILSNIKHAELDYAHSELVNFTDQINQQFIENNLTDKAAQTNYLIQTYDKDILAKAQKIYTKRLDQQYIVQHFIPLDVAHISIQIMEESPTCTIVSQKFMCVADQVFENAELCQLNFLSEIKPCVYASIKAIGEPREAFDFVCNLTAVDHILYNIQQQSNDLVEGIYTPINESCPLLDAIDTIHNEELEKQIPFTEQMAELKHQQEMYKHLHTIRKQCLPLLTYAIDRRMQVLNKSIKRGKIHLLSKQCKINKDVAALLQQYKHDTKPFTRFEGNEYQSVLHKESIDILDAINQLSHTSHLYDYRGALVDYAAAICEYNQDGLTHKASQVADLCWTLLDYGSAVAEGAALGVQGAVTEMINHPIQTAAFAFAGEYVLAYQVCKVACDVAGIGITALTDKTKAKKEWNDYIAPFNQFIDAIKQEKMTLREVIRSGTAIAVRWKADGKVLKGMGKLCKNIKTKAITFAQNNPLVKPKDYMATPEGMLFKTTKKAIDGGTTQKVANQVEKQIEKTITTTVVKNIANEASELLRTFNISRYDPSIGNLNKLEEAIEKLKNIPGALTTDGPLFKALECGQKVEVLTDLKKISEINGRLQTARGAMYEVEKTLELVKAGEKVVELGSKINGREFDIATKTKLIECKNIDWLKKSSKDIEDMKKIFGHQKKIASDKGKLFEVVSKQFIPESWKSWFLKKEILFFEEV